MKKLTWLVALPLAACDLYLAPASFLVSPGERIAVAFHCGDSFPESDRSPALARLRDAALHTARGVYNITNLRAEGKATLGDASIRVEGTVILAARRLPEVVERPGAEFTAYLKRHGLEEELRWREEHGEAGKPARERANGYAKSLVVSQEPSEFYRHSIGAAIEIVPESDPWELKTGESLPVRVLWRGKPAGGLLIRATHAGMTGTIIRDAGRTDADGRVEVPIIGRGKWRLDTIAMERCADASIADWESYSASLTFEVR